MKREHDKNYVSAGWRRLALPIIAIPRIGFAFYFAVLTIGTPASPAAEAERPGAPTADSSRTAIAIEALSRLQGVDLEQNPKLKEAVLKVLATTRGTPAFVKIVRQFQLTNQNAGLLEIALQAPASDAGVDAMRLILASQDFTLLQQRLDGTNTLAALKTAEALGNTGENGAARILRPLAADAKRPLELRKQAVRALAQSLEGARDLIELAKAQKLEGDLKSIAGSELNRVRWPEIKAQADGLFPLPAAPGNAPVAISALLKMKGDPSRGANVFSSAAAGCASCHQIKGRGVDFGPNLSEIGSKLAKEALYEAILNPSSGISFGYEAWQLELKSGGEAYGLVVSDAADEVAVKDAKGIITRYKKSDILGREQMKLSIMPSGLEQAVTTQELADLVEYLCSLKSAAAH